MAVIPAYCPSCQILFPSAFASMFGGSVTLQNNAETCPSCGRLAMVANGAFNIAGDIVTIISAPDITRQMFATLNEAIRKAYQEKKSPEETAKEVEKIVPALGSVIRTGWYWL